MTLLGVGCWEANGLERLEDMYPTPDVVEVAPADETPADKPVTDPGEVQGDSLAGRWAVRVVQKGTTTPESIGESWPLAVTDFFVADVPVDRKKASLTFCGETVEIVTDNPFKPATAMPKALVEALAKEAVDVALDGDDSVPASEVVWLWGLKNLKDPAKDKLPADPKDAEHVRDQDGDGKPGVTIEVKAPMVGERYLVRRALWSLGEGMLSKDMSTVDGSLAFSIEEQGLGAVPELLNQASPITAAKDGNVHRWRRTGPAFDCAALMADPAAIFGN